MFSAFRTFLLALLLLAATSAPYMTDEPEEHNHEETEVHLVATRTPHYPV